MDSSRLLIVGAEGQLGRALCQKYPDAKATTKEQLDITDVESLESYDWGQVDTIINAAAYTKVDAAETPEGREQAWQINAQGPAYLARMAILHGLILVHVSSDYVFDGTGNNHSEDRPFSPLSVYGQTKAAGDLAVSTVPKNYTIRTTWLIGEGHNFIKTMLGLGGKGINPEVVKDQIGRLTFTTDLVDGIDHLLTHEAAFGTYNLTGDGEPASWADIARLAFKASGLNNIVVTGVTTDQYSAGKHVAPRPLNSDLDLRKIKKAGFQPSDWRDSLQAYVTSL